LPSSAYGLAEVDTKRLPASMTTEQQPDYSSFQAFRESQLNAHGVVMPEAELRQRYPVNPDGTVGEDATPKWVRDAIFAGIQKPKYSSIHVPVLANPCRSTPGWMTSSRSTNQGQQMSERLWNCVSQDV